MKVSTLSSSNFTDGKILLTERIHSAVCNILQT